MGARRNSTRILGRERELAVLEDALEALDDGMPSIVLVAGDAGVGKTRLVDEFVLRAEKIRAVRGGCADLASPAAAYAPWTEILWWLLRGLDDDQLDTLVAGGRPHLARLLPALGAPAEGDDDGQRGLFEAVVEVFERAGAEIPLTVVIEDAHWIDSASADLLRYVALNLRRAPMVLIVTYRLDTMTPALRDLTTQLAHAGGIRISVDPLTADDAAHVAAMLLDLPTDSPEVTRVVERAEGVPLLLEELAAAGGGNRLPTSVRDLMLVRFASLDDEAQTLVRTAAIIGAHVRRSLLVDASGLHDAGARTAARSAVDAGILVVDDDVSGYRFHHALLREAVLADLIPDERVAQHRRVADALAGTREPIDADRAGMLAYHFTAAECSDDAFRWSITAAELEAERFAYLAALAHHERALESWDHIADPAALARRDHVAMLTTAAELADHGGRCDLALEFQRKALDETKATDLARAADMASLVALYSWHMGEDFESTMAWAVDAARKSHHPNLSGLLALQAGANNSTGRYADAIAIATEALAMPDIDLLARTRALQMRGTSRVAIGEIERGITDARAATEAAQQLGDDWQIAAANHNYASILVDTGAYRDALEAIDAGVAVAAGRELSGLEAGLRALGAEACCLLGDPSRADAYLAPVDSAHLTGFDAGTVPLTRANIARCRGDLDRLEHFLAETRADRITVTRMEEAKRLWLDVECAYWRGDFDHALSLVLDQITATSSIEAADFGAIVKAAASARAEVALRGKLHGYADTDIDAVRIDLGAANPAHIEARAFAEAEDQRGQRADTVETWQLALEHAERIELQYDQVLCRWRLGQVLAREGDRSGARAALTVAHEQAERIDAAHLVAAIAKSAATVSTRLRGTIKGGGDTNALSSREVEVLDLLAAGGTNPEIAEQLFISRRTVRAHLSNIFVKLGASNRTEAVTIAQRRGLID